MPEKIKLLLNLCMLAAVTVLHNGIFAQDVIQSMASPGMIFELLALDRDIPTKQFPKYRSPIALVPSRDGRFLYVAQQTAKRIAVVDIALKKVIKTIQLPNEVTGIAVAPGGMLYATCSSDLWPQGIVCEVDAVKGKVLRRIPAGAGARSPVVAADGKTLHICNQYSDDVYFIDILSGKVVKKLHVCREPFSCSLTPDGKVLVVASCLPMQKATDLANVAAKVVFVNTAGRSVDAEVPLPAGSHSVFDVAISPDGSYALITHLAGMFTLKATVIEGGWIHTNNLAVVDIKRRRLLNDFPLDEEKRAAANPWKAACTGDNTTLCVTHAGSNELSVIDMRKMISIAIAKSGVKSVEKGLEFTGCSHDFSALSSCKKRIDVAGKSPRALAIIGRKVYTAGYFGDSSGNDYIEMFDLAQGKGAVLNAGIISLGKSQPPGSIRRGEMAFYDGTLCHQAWQSCASCHPSARTDGLNWTLSRDALASPKNAKSMLYSWWTPPTQWAGKRANAAESVRLGFRNSLFVNTDYRLSAYIDTFLMHIKPVPSPFLVRGRLSPEAARGRNVFYQDRRSDCVYCHTGPLYTDMRFHSSGIPEKWDVFTLWDTPSLSETWRNAPYGHIGSFDKVEDIIRYSGHSRCIMNGISEEHFLEMVKYVMSL